MIALRLLGPADATVDGGPPPPELLWRKHLALVAYLALAPDRRAGREQLTGLLWGDKPEDAARHSLAEALRIVRRCTDDGVEDVGTGYVRLGAGAVESDTDAFAAHMEAGDPAAAAELISGELMQGFAIADAWAFEEWLASRRREWHARMEEALVAAAEVALAEGEPDRAHAHADRALDLLPTSDRACQMAMRSLCLRGDRGRALKAYESFAGWLSEELDILPAAETEALAERIRQQRRWRLPTDRATRKVHGAESRRTPLIGRGPELTSLLREWDACRIGDGPRAGIIAGDPGTGRSRLLSELIERARLDGATIAVARALPADRESDGAVLEALTRDRDPDITDRASSLRELLESVSSETPLLLAVDDAAWADDPSLDRLCAIAARTPDPHTMVAMTTVPSPDPAVLDRLIAGLGRDVRGTLVALEPLDAEALRELAEWGVPEQGNEALDRLTRRLAADTAGYPLLAVELLHAVAHGLSPTDGPAAWPASGKTLEQTRPGDLPGTLVAAVRVGFRVLSAEGQRALAAAAVLEPPVPADRIAQATGLEGEELEQALDELEWGRWLVADPRGYSFVARLVREIVSRDMVTAGQRQRILDA